MSLYRIADYIVDIQSRYDFLKSQCREYEYSGDLPIDFSLKATEEEIKNEAFISGEKYPVGYLESVCVYRKLGMLLPSKNAVLMHASVIDIKGRGVAFMAPSGVGKTTHTLLWMKLYGDVVRVINGDKPILRFWEDIPFAYGTPWAGKENLQTNSRTKLTDLCFLEQSDYNQVESLDKNECIAQIMQQVLHPGDSVAALKTLELLDKLLRKCNVWKIKCNINPEAAEIAYEKIFKSN